MTRERMSAPTSDRGERAASRPGPDRGPAPRGLRIQDAIGNRAVGRLLRARGNAGPAAAPVAVSPTGLAIQRTCAACSGGGAPCPACEEEQPTIHRKARPGGDSVAGAVGGVPSASSGHALGPGTRRFMESRFGHDFGGVRVHTDGPAAAAAEGLRAHAFTVGQDIYFGAGRYQPHSPDGQRLLAHELTHTLQQRAASPLGGAASQARRAVSQPGDPLEREADALADRVVAGGTTGGYTVSPAPPSIQRDVLDDLGSGIESVASDIGGVVSSGVSAVEGGVKAAVQAGGDAVDAAVQAGRDALDWAKKEGQQAVDWAEQKGSQALDWAKQKGGQALDWAETEAGRLALEEANALAGLFGGAVRVTPAGLVITIPDIPLFPTINEVYPMAAWGMFVPLIGGGTTIGPIPIAGGIGLLVWATGELVVAAGPGMIRGITIILDPLAGRYSATGQLYAAVAAGPRLTLFGGLAAAAAAILPTAPPIPLVVSIEGGLRATGTGYGIGAIQSTVTLAYAAGTLSFDAINTLMLGVLLQGDLDLFAALRIELIDVCHYAYRLGHWQTGAAYQFTLPVRASLGPGGPTGGIGPITQGPIPVSSILTAIKPVPTGWDCWTLEEIRDLLCKIGILPPILCPTAPGPSTLRNELALAICKCVGDAKCGGGKINKKCFTVKDTVCKNHGALQKAADDICNHDPDMVKACDRGGGCRYRHTDAKCPVKEDECPGGGSWLAVSPPGPTGARPVV